MVFAPFVVPCHSKNAEAGSPTTIVQKTDYIWDDAVTATLTSATGKYLISFPALVRTEDSGGTNRASCAYTSYDCGAYATGQQGSLARGLVTTADTYTSCGTSPGFTPSGRIEVTTTYDAFGNEITTNDPDANAGNSAHKGCTVGSSTYSSCHTVDATFSALPNLKHECAQPERDAWLRHDDRRDWRFRAVVY